MSHVGRSYELASDNFCCEGARREVQDARKWGNCPGVMDHDVVVGVRLRAERIREVEDLPT